MQYRGIEQVFYLRGMVEPTHCPAGHVLGPPLRGVIRALNGWTPCMCPAARARYKGHSLIYCQGLRCKWIWHDPAHEGEDWTWGAS